MNPKVAQIASFFVLIVFILSMISYDFMQIVEIRTYLDVFFINVIDISAIIRDVGKQLFHFVHLCSITLLSLMNHNIIRKTCPCNEYPLSPTFI